MLYIKGYIQHEKTIILCLEYKEIELNTTHGKFDDRWWWVIASEIVNTKHVLTMQVDTNLIKIFERHSDLLYLKNELNRKYGNACCGVLWKLCQSHSRINRYWTSKRTTMEH